MKTRIDAEMERLSEEYKVVCKEETKKYINSMINNFIDDDSVDKLYKEKILNIIVNLLCLK